MEVWWANIERDKKG